MSFSQPFLRVGTAGWSYKDWYGIVYPEHPEKQFKELDYLAGFFDTAEVNSTFYRPPNPHMSAAWVRKVSHNPNFKFTAKLWRRFTHEREAYTDDEIGLVRAGFDPMMEAGKLGAVLIQFPWSFRNDEKGHDWLNGLFDTFRLYPLVVELRHGGWDTPQTIDMLRKQNIGFAAIDQPVIGKSMGFKPIRTGDVGYVRTHGRNYKAWFAKHKGDQSQDRSPLARYDYLYSEKEIDQIAEKVKTVSEGSRETYVIQNNHPWGQAVANSVQLRAALGDELLRIPETLLSRFPELGKIATVVPAGENPDGRSPT